MDVIPEFESFIKLVERLDTSCKIQDKDANKQFGVYLDGFYGTTISWLALISVSFNLTINVRSQAILLLYESLRRDATVYIPVADKSGASVLRLFDLLICTKDKDDGDEDTLLLFSKETIKMIHLILDIIMQASQSIPKVEYEDLLKKFKEISISDNQPIQRLKTLELIEIYWDGLSIQQDLFLPSLLGFVTDIDIQIQRRAIKIINDICQRGECPTVTRESKFMEAICQVGYKVGENHLEMDDVIIDKMKSQIRWITFVGDEYKHEFRHWNDIIPLIHPSKYKTLSDNIIPILLDKIFEGFTPDSFIDFFFKIGITVGLKYFNKYLIKMVLRFKSPKAPLVPGSLFLKILSHFSKDDHISLYAPVFMGLLFKEAPYPLGRCNTRMPLSSWLTRLLPQLPTPYFKMITDHQLLALSLDWQGTTNNLTDMLEEMMARDMTDHSQYLLYNLMRSIITVIQLILENATNQLSLPLDLTIDLFSSFELLDRHLYGLWENNIKLVELDDHLSNSSCRTFAYHFVNLSFALDNSYGTASQIISINKKVIHYIEPFLTKCRSAIIELWSSHDQLMFHSKFSQDCQLLVLSMCIFLSENSIAVDGISDVGQLYSYYIPTFFGLYKDNIQNYPSKIYGRTFWRIIIQVYNQSTLISDQRDINEIYRLINHHATEFIDSNNNAAASKVFLQNVPSKQIGLVYQKFT
ncbi:hypothetical protein DFA_05220 [Cavenderia fasciculata]|uniref:Uncharacterized protein n=1 Tax=Cavenderia fasciculata TaxID=261658 RepID=F4PNN7_CACFS|nr:uncharacterized protein DFA_05220 [Cavenderia fasciculata]EGG23090.1 hypothetical protein DFA_05220 [Cavenderia fasciculata]|eukprot:XP_004360941.1 hypothetical protein DFA_05220 [Cavenderia fasciculata]